MSFPVTSNQELAPSHSSRGTPGQGGWGLGLTLWQPWSQSVECAWCRFKAVTREVMPALIFPSGLRNHRCLVTPESCDISCLFLLLERSDGQLLPSMGNESEAFSTCCVNFDGKLYLLLHKRSNFSKIKLNGFKHHSSFEVLSSSLFSEANLCSFVICAG